MTKHDVTLITLEYPPARGGVARYLHDLVDAAGGRIRVLVQADVGAVRTATVESVECFRSGWPAWRPLIDICRRLRDQTRVILVSHVFPVGTAAWISKMFGGPEYAVILHGLDVRMVRGWWKRWLFACICRDAKAVFVNSVSTKQDVARILPGKTVCVLTPGIHADVYPTRETARAELGIGAGTELVVSVCRLVPRKGIDMSLRAMSRLQPKRPVMYVVLGDGPDAERLQEIAQRVGARVRWVRNASDDEKRMWLAAADVFLLPVREDEGDVEGFGIVYLEAALAGIPSVAGRSGGASEAVIHERTGLLVHPHRIEEIEECVTTLLENSELRQKMGANGRERAKTEFRWRDRWSVVRKVLDIDP